MTKIHKHISETLLLFIILITGGCQLSPKCTVSTEVYCHTRFVTLVNEQDKDTLLTDTDIYGLAREDSLLTAGKQTVNKIDLPMEPDRDSCSYVIRYNGTTDTLLFSYKRSVRLLSFECGFIQEYTLSQVSATNHQIDSVAIVDSLVTNIDHENLKIYLFRH